MKQQKIFNGFRNKSSFINCYADSKTDKHGELKISQGFRFKHTTKMRILKVRTVKKYSKHTYIMYE